MLISYNWLKELLDFSLNAKELGERLTVLGFELDGLNELSKKLDGFVVAQVLSKEKHPDADKLSVCTVSTCGEPIQVICGAPNVAAGQKVIFGNVGAVVPSAGFKLEKRKIRGIVSNGMICSQTELELGDDSSGIWELPSDAPVGTPASQYFGINDAILDLAVTPNRADCLSHIGFAREVSALVGSKLKYPDLNLVETGSDINNEIEIEVINKVDCPRYAARVVKGVKIAPSPAWLEKRLSSIGLRPRNNIVDITNLIMHELGQPLHAFDLDTISGSKIIVKNAEKGQKFTTLDSKNRILDENMLMICDAQNPVAVAGVMGGENSEITDQTINVLIESAYFNPSSVRKTAKKLGIHSDASYRYERGVDPALAINAVNRAAKLIAEIAGGDISKGIIDVNNFDFTPKAIELRYNRIKQICGIDISNEKANDYLTSLGFQISEIGDTSCMVVAPSYRFDINTEIDLVEEVLRLYGLDNLEADFISKVDFTSSELMPEKLLTPNNRRKLVDYLSAKGFNEIFTKNLTGPSGNADFGDAVKVANPLGEEFSELKNNPLVSALKVISLNQRVGNHDLSLFELSRTFLPVNSNNSFIPNITEKEWLLVIMSGKSLTNNWISKGEKYDYYTSKSIYEEITSYFNLNTKKLINGKLFDGFGANSQSIWRNDEMIACYGEISKKLLKKYEVEGNVVACIIDAKHIYSGSDKLTLFPGISQFPTSKRDLAFVLGKDIAAGDVLREIKSNAGEILRNLNVFDVYYDEKLGDNKKSLAFTLTYGSNSKTLTDEEIDASVNKIIAKVEKTFAAQLRK